MCEYGRVYIVNKCVQSGVCECTYMLRAKSNVGL